MNLDQLPPLGSRLAAAGITAHHRLGQHFLLDLNLCRKIARLSGAGPGDVIIEVGPGPGGLTRALLETGASVIAVEKDQRFVPILSELAAAAKGRLSVVRADALTVDEAALVGTTAPARIVANLPYNVGSALLLKWLTGPYRPASMTLMFQKEVAGRIVAPPGGGAYGRLSVITQALCQAVSLMDLPAAVFTPPPKVDSTVVGLTARTPPLADPIIAALETVTRAAFGQRRKMLRSALRELGGEALCAAAGIDANARAQTIPIEGYLRLAGVLMRTGPALR